ncbi:MAG: sulfur carrier protein ThiS, partial [Chloroflexi bacterium]|nr:sulfur carrier protein ThiS [Chloroflexota bacterium]
MITFTVNGKLKEMEIPTLLIDFLRGLEVNLQFVAVAYNGHVVDRDSFPRIVLDEGDEIEVVR